MVSLGHNELKCISFLHLFEAQWHILLSSKGVIIGSGNGLAPVWCQAIICTNIDLFSIIHSRTNLSKAWIKIQFCLEKLHFILNMWSANFEPFCTVVYVLFLPGLTITSHTLRSFKADFFHLLSTHLPLDKNGRHFGRRHFQMHFRERKWWYSNPNFTEACSQESNWQ